MSGRCTVRDGSLGIFRRGAFVNTLELLLHALLGQVRCVVPDVVLSSVVDLREVLVRRLDAGGGVGGGIPCHVSEQDRGILDYRQY